MALQNVCYISKEVVNNFLCLSRSLFKSQRRFKWPSLVAYMQSFEISFRTRIGNFLALLSCHDSGKIIFGKNMLPQIYFLLMLLKKNETLNLIDCQTKTHYLTNTHDTK